MSPMQPLSRLWWIVLGISAGTDAVVAFSTALVSAMVEAAQGSLPGPTTLLIAAAGALVAAGRTVQQALKALGVLPANGRPPAADPPPKP